MLFILHYNMIFFLKFSFITVVLSEECSLVKKMSNLKKKYI